MHEILTSLLCFRLLETVLGYINAVAQSMEKNTDTLTVKFWRALLSKAYDTLDKVAFHSPDLLCFVGCFYVTVILSDVQSFTLRINLAVDFS